MLSFVPVIFAEYRKLPPRMWPVMQALVAHADRDGKCWPSVRRLADITGVPRSTVSRYLTAITRAGHLSRTRKPGGVYVYTIGARWLPAAVSQHRPKAVPSGAAATVPTPAPKNETSKKISDSALPDDLAKWGPRLRSWHRSGGRFWNAFWGPRPNEAGCFVPAAVLQSAQPSG
jgi:hypothetical protein